MKNRQAFEMKRAMQFYDIFQIFFNGWIGFNLLRLTFFNGYSLICQPVDYSDNEQALETLKIGYYFYLSKLFDLTDTLFFVLRKKDNQITFLHVFHHGFMPISVWPCFRYIAGGHTVFYAICNSFVHFIMYIYYLLASMGPNVQKYLWWKKYLTTLQMIQFVCIALHCIPLLFVDCGFPVFYFWYTVAQALLFFILFRNFFVKTYKKANSNQDSNSPLSPVKKRS